MLCGNLIGYIAHTYYIFSGKFPTAYKIMVPPTLMMSFILVSQRIYYHASKIPKHFKLIYGFIFTFFAIFTPIFMVYKPDIYFISGWLCALSWCLYQIPQIMKIYKEKSFSGFSFRFVSIAAGAAILEFATALALKMPMQTLVNDVRVMVIYIIFAAQFYLYEI